MAVGRTILHVDINSFFAAVEQQSDPRLRGKPIAVAGGRDKGRNIAIAASVEAKKRGVKTGTPAWEAIKFCPELIWIKADHHKYTEVSRKLLRIYRDITPEIEIFSVDEAFLDVTSTLHLYSSARSAAEQIKRRMRAEVGEWISCSIGIAPNKFLAKLASDTFKPDALMEVERGNERWLLDSVELEDFCGIGRRVKKRFHSLGIDTVRQLADADPYRIRRSLGINGLRLHWAAQGIDPTPLDLHYARSDPKSMGHQMTLPENTTDLVYLDEMLMRLCEQVGRRLRREGYMAKWLHLWFRYHDFHSRGFRIKLGYPTDRTARLIAEARLALGQIKLEPIRLLGVTATGLVPKVALSQSLFPEERQVELLDEAVDNVNDRYGEFTLVRGVIPSKETDKQVIPKHFGNKRISF